MPTQSELAGTRHRFSGDDWIHVFSGFGSYPLVKAVSKILLARERRCGVMAEIPMLFGAHILGFRDRVILLRDRIRALTRWKNMGFLLAIGDMGAAWYRKAWYPEKKIFPFAYFLDETKFVEKEPMAFKLEGVFRILFVGRLVRLKAVDVLIEALATLQAMPWRLDIVGDGPERENLLKLADTLRLTSRIRWHGVLENVKTRAMISGVNLLVLPSHHDGWGAVVSEALLAGTPVITTETCGSSVAVAFSGGGKVVPHGSREALGNALLKAIKKGPLSERERASLRRWAHCLTGESGATYFLSIMRFLYDNGPRPSPPWVLDVHH